MPGLIQSHSSLSVSSFLNTNKVGWHFGTDTLVALTLLFHMRLQSHYNNQQGTTIAFLRPWFSSLDLNYTSAFIPHFQSTPGLSPHGAVVRQPSSPPAGDPRRSRPERHRPERWHCSYQNGVPPQAHREPAAAAEALGTRPQRNAWACHGDPPGISGRWRGKLARGRGGKVTLVVHFGLSHSLSQSNSSDFPRLTFHEGVTPVRCIGVAVEVSSGEMSQIYETDWILSCKTELFQGRDAKLQNC